jgi:hypothetical protein
MLYIVHLKENRIKLCSAEELVEGNQQKICKISNLMAMKR